MAGLNDYYKWSYGIIKWLSDYNLINIKEENKSTPMYDCSLEHTHVAMKNLLNPQNTHLQRLFFSYALNFQPDFINCFRPLFYYCEMYVNVCIFSLIMPHLHV